MRNKLLFFGTFTLCAVLSLQPSHATAEPKDILELYELAKTKDPVVGKAEARLEAGKADQDIALSALMPRISANASQRRFWHKVFNYGPATMDGSYEGFGYNIGGQLPIFNIPSYLQISAADAGQKSAEAGVAAARQDLIVRLADAYIKLLKAQADEKLYRDELARVSEILKQTEAFLKAGTGDIIAVYEARARMDSAAADLVKTEAQRQIAEQSLSSLTGIIVTAVKDIQVGTPIGPQPDNLDWWIETMYKQNPSIRQAQEDLAQAGHYSDANRAAHAPTIQFIGGYSVDKGSTFLPEVETRQWYIGANVSLPIYSGGETVARTRRAVAGESERRFMLEDSRDQQTRRVKESFLNLRYNASLAEAYKRKHASTELQLTATRKGREIGTRTAIDLLNAEQSYAVSHRDLVGVLYDNLQRSLELKAAAGILTESDLTLLNSAQVAAVR
jgi:outer membrane protein